MAFFLRNGKHCLCRKQPDEQCIGTCMCHSRSFGQLVCLDGSCAPGDAPGLCTWTWNGTCGTWTAPGLCTCTCLQEMYAFTLACCNASTVCATAAASNNSSVLTGHMHLPAGDVRVHAGVLQRGHRAYRPAQEDDGAAALGHRHANPVPADLL